MGQQQLLLLVFGIVIVAIAVVGGFVMFEENIKKNNSESLVSEAVNIASAAQAWKIRPSTFGGQSGTPRSNPMDFSGFTFNAISLQSPYISSIGVFTYTADARGLVIVGQSQAHGNQVTLTVDGLTEKDIIAVVSALDEDYSITDQ